MTNTSVPYVVFSHSTLLEYYRVMGTVQVCTCCGHKHKGSLATEVFVVFSTIKGVGGTQVEVRGSIPLRVLKARYAYYLRRKPTEVDEYLPELPCRVEWTELQVDQCDRCFKGVMEGARKALPPLMPLDPELAAYEAVKHKGNIEDNNKDTRNNKDSKKAKPKVRAATLTELGSF